MIAEFVIVSFASFIGWQIFTHLRFFPVSVRIAPLLVLALSYGITFLSTPSFLIALASTGGVAILNKYTDASSPDPWKFPSLKIKRKNNWPETGLPPRQTASQQRSEPGHRIAQL